MKIIAVGQRHSGVSYHRLFNPVMYLEKEFAMMTDSLNDEILEKGYDIVLVNRYIYGLEIDQLLEYKKKYNFKLIVDIDDYWYLDAWHILYGKYPTQKVIDHIKAADLVTCTNLELFHHIIEYNRNCNIIPNALPYGEEQFVDTKTESDKVRFVYAGSITHEKDIAILKNPMKRVAADQYVKRNTEFIFCGYEPENKYSLPIWSRMINDYLCGFSVNGYVRAALPVTEYMNFYNEADVCLIPLVGSKFNSMKSNLKVLEAAAKSACVIASDVMPYSNEPYALKVNNQSDWFKMIKKVTKDPIYRKEKGLANAENCKALYDLKKVNQLRKEIYQSCL